MSKMGKLKSLKSMGDYDTYEEAQNNLQYIHANENPHIQQDLNGKFIIIKNRRK